MQALPWMPAFNSSLLMAAAEPSKTSLPGGPMTPLPLRKISLALVSGVNTLVSCHSVTSAAGLSAASGPCQSGGWQLLMAQTMLRLVNGFFAAVDQFAGGI